MNLELLQFVAFTVVLVASVLGGHYIHTRHFKYATEGSSAMVLGTTLAGLLWLGYLGDQQEAVATGHILLARQSIF